MSQYFEFVNTDREEVIVPPDGIGLNNILNDKSGSDLLAWVLLDGPADGTGLNSVPLSALPDEAIAEKQADIQDRCDDLEESPYHDGEAWIEAKLARIVAAGLHVSNIYDYAGRWAGDSVTIAGDYADDTPYGAWRDHAIVTVDDGTGGTEDVVLKHRGTCRKVTVQQRIDGSEQIERHQKTAQPGDYVEVGVDDSPTDEPQAGELQGYVETSVSNITSEVEAELDAVQTSSYTPVTTPVGANA